jgi:hypothetical protein
MEKHDEAREVGEYIVEVTMNYYKSEKGEVGYLGVVAPITVLRGRVVAAELRRHLLRGPVAPCKAERGENKKKSAPQCGGILGTKRGPGRG